MRTLAQKILNDYRLNKSVYGSINTLDAVKLAEMVLSVHVLRCATCQESNLVDKPQLFTM